MTLLEMVQDILSDMEGDVVTSYTDTVESQQVAQIIKSTYSHIISGKDWPHLYHQFHLEGSYAARPTSFDLPLNLMSLDNLLYNVKLSELAHEEFKEMLFVEPREFMLRTAQRRSENDNVLIVTNAESAHINIYTDRMPTFYTSFNETSIMLDSYHSDVDDRLRINKILAYGKLMPTVVMSDSLYFDLPANAYSLLLEESKSNAFLVLKQMANPKAEQRAVTQRRRMAQASWKIRNGITYPDFGRRGKR